MRYRTETDTLGKVRVPSDKLYGAQTMRSHENFKVGTEKIPLCLIYAIAKIKQAAAISNYHLKLISKDKKEWIVKASKEIQKGNLDDHFPLVVWQTGSATQTNMNVNEVISNYASKMHKKALGSHKPLHPNDDVNMSQSSNDVIPSAIHLGSLTLLIHKLFPALELICRELKKKEKEWKGVIKVGRTHMMDAVPISLSQEFSAYRAQLEYVCEKLNENISDLSYLPIGGTAVGTGLNTKKTYRKIICDTLTDLMDIPIYPAKNTFSMMAGKDQITALSGTLKILAGVLFKMANDIRISGSGPRAGIFELILPANEPGSSIMPGKINPTQCEMLTMVSLQVMGNDTTITIAGSSGQYQLNTYMPVIAYNLFQSIDLLTDAIHNFVKKCLKHLKPNKENIERHLERSLMFATALNRKIGYENASKIVKKALRDDCSLKEAALKLKILTNSEYDEIIQISKMIEPNL
jgi:fumarate hydratase, class II